MKRAGLSYRRPRESLGLQPIIEFIDPVVAGGALLFMAKPWTPVVKMRASAR